MYTAASESRKGHHGQGIHISCVFVPSCMLNAAGCRSSNGFNNAAQAACFPTSLLKSEYALPLSYCVAGAQLMNMAEGMMGGNKPQGQGGYQEGGQQQGGALLCKATLWQTIHCMQGAQRQSACPEDPAHCLARAHRLSMQATAARSAHRRAMAVKVKSAHADDVSHECQRPTICSGKERTTNMSVEMHASNPTLLGIILSH